jgi:general secretion pathway protein G
VPVDPITNSADTWTLIAPTDGNAVGIADIKSSAAGTALDGSSFDSL